MCTENSEFLSDTSEGRGLDEGHSEESGAAAGTAAADVVAAAAALASGAAGEVAGHVGKSVAHTLRLDERGSALCPARPQVGQMQLPVP